MNKPQPAVTVADTLAAMVPVISAFQSAVDPRPHHIEQPDDQMASVTEEARRMTAAMKSSQDSCEKMEKQARLVQDQLRQVNNKHAVEEAVQAAIKEETRRNRPQYSSSLPPPHTIEEAVQSAIKEELRRSRPAPQYSLFTPPQGSPSPAGPYAGYPSSSPPAPPQPTSPWSFGYPSAAPPASSA